MDSQTSSACLGFPWLRSFAALAAFLWLASAASAGSVVIDMPAPPRSAESGEAGGNTYVDYTTMAGHVDVGDVALLRYARARYAPYYTAPYYGGYGPYYYRRFFVGYPHYGAYYVPWAPYRGYPFFIGCPFFGHGLGFQFCAFPTFVRVVH